MGRGEKYSEYGKKCYFLPVSILTRFVLFAKTGKKSTAIVKILAKPGDFFVKPAILSHIPPAS